MRNVWLRSSQFLQIAVSVSNWISVLFIVPCLLLFKNPERLARNVGTIIILRVRYVMELLGGETVYVGIDGIQLCVDHRMAVFLPFKGRQRASFNIYLAPLRWRPLCADILSLLVICVYYITNFTIHLID